MKQWCKQLNATLWDDVHGVSISTVKGKEDQGAYIDNKLNKRLGWEHWGPTRRTEAISIFWGGWGPSTRAGQWRECFISQWWSELCCFLWDRPRVMDTNRLNKLIPKGISFGEGGGGLSEGGFRKADAVRATCHNSQWTSPSHSTKCWSNTEAHSWLIPPTCTEGSRSCPRLSNFSTPYSECQTLSQFPGPRTYLNESEQWFNTAFLLYI